MGIGAMKAVTRACGVDDRNPVRGQVPETCLFTAAIVHTPASIGQNHGGSRWQPQGIEHLGRRSAPRGSPCKAKWNNEMVAERDQPLRGGAAAPFDIAEDRKAEIASPSHDIQRPGRIAIYDQDGCAAEDI